MLTRFKLYLNSDSAGLSWIERTYKILLIAATGGLLVFVLTWPFPRNTQYQQLNVGDIIPSDIVAPARKSFVSEILTAQAQERASESIPPLYDPPSGRVRHQQTEEARQVLEFISIVREDPFATDEVRTDYLGSIYDLSLSQEEILAILTLSQDEWSQIAAEIPLTLGRVMREEIHDNEGALTNAKRRVPGLIGVELSEASLELTSALVGDLIVPNSFRNEDGTNALRTEAASAVEAVWRSFEQGENVIRRNTKITAEDLEALEELGLLQTEWSWWVLVRAVFISLLLISAVLLAIYRLYPDVLASTTRLSVLALTTGIWLLSAKFMIIPHPWLPYLYPLATLGMLLSVLVDLRIAVIMTLAFSLVVLLLSSANDVYIVFLGMSSLFGALILGRAERLTAFLWTGVVVVLSNLCVYAALRLPFQDFVGTSQLQDILLLVINGFLSASIALLGYFVLGNLFGLTTSLQLTELSRPTHPLLRQLLLKSPGTYHHTIVVSNMAERAAAAIGADAMLTRVGAYYHDIGKTVRPYFFIENSADGAESPHARLDPLTSAQIIISHVSDGIDLAQKYNLPVRIQDFIREHHGEAIIKSFYIPAQELANQSGEELDEKDFRYAGPSPRTKETAILMLADTCESAVRAIRPNTRQDMADLITRLIDDRVDDGDLNQCNLTFQELQIVKDIFGQVLQGVHHPRISYPATKNAASQSSSSSQQDVPQAQIKDSVPHAENSSNPNNAALPNADATAGALGNMSPNVGSSVATSIANSISDSSIGDGATEKSSRTSTVSSMSVSDVTETVAAIDSGNAHGTKSSKLQPETGANNGASKRPKQGLSGVSSSAERIGLDGKTRHRERTERVPGGIEQPV